MPWRTPFSYQYQGPPGYPANALTFVSSGFSDPQGSGDFAAVQWRVAEVTDAAAPAYDPLAKFKLEWAAEHDSGPLPPGVAPFTFPGDACEAGHAYRVRVRHMDASGRWSHWSAPVEFIAGASTDDLPIVVSELLYKPSDPTPAEVAAGFDDQEFFE